MTFLEHGLYGGAIAYAVDPNYFWVGVIAGIAPDIPWFIAASYVNGPKKVVNMLIHKDKTIESSATVLKTYYFSHSFVTAFTLYLLLFFMQKQLAFLALPYAFHILCDMPFHRETYATRFLYPLSTFHFQGYSQRFHRWVLLAQYPIIAIIYCYLFFLHLH